MADDSNEITDVIVAAADQARREVSAEPEPEFTGTLQWPVECTVGPGLEGAIACETKVGYVNGTRGCLVYRGYDIFDLCAHSSFEEASYLLLHGDLPSREQLDTFNTKLVQYRHLPKTLRLIMGFPLEEMNTMAALRMGTNLMRQSQTERDLAGHSLARDRIISSDEDSIPMEQESKGAKRAAFEFRDRNLDRPKPGKAARDQEAGRGLESCYHLIAGVATLTAAIARLRQGGLPIEPDPELSHAGNLLYMMTGRRPNPLEERAMDVALVLHADHGMNASTFATMVVASTLSDVYFSIGSGIAALNGPLHGGANAEVMHMLREIGGARQVKRWYDRMRAHKGKIMGFGHRVYKAYDPRARVLAPLAARLVERSRSTEMKALLQTARELERVVVDDLGTAKGIFPNVDFYSGLVYACLGIPMEMFTPIFATARVSGWCARVLEYLKTNRIFRPRGVYVGGFDREYLPFNDRDSIPIAH